MIEFPTLEGRWLILRSIEANLTIAASDRKGGMGGGGRGGVGGGEEGGGLSSPGNGNNVGWSERKRKM